MGFYEEISKIIPYLQISSNMHLISSDQRLQHNRFKTKNGHFFQFCQKKFCFNVAMLDPVHNMETIHGP